MEPLKYQNPFLVLTASTHAKRRLRISWGFLLPTGMCSFQKPRGSTTSGTEGPPTHLSSGRLVPRSYAEEGGEREPRRFLFSLL